MALFKKEALERIEHEERLVPRRPVLIVDDEEHNLTALKYVLAPHYEVLTASDGQEALELLQNDPDPHRIHLIISDQRMPRMTGVDFLAESIPIIPHAIRVVLTGFTDVEAIMDSINLARIYKFILKPFDEHDILLTAKRGLELFDLEQRNRRLVETLEFFNGQFFNHTRGILQQVSGSTGLMARKNVAGMTEEQKRLLEQMGTSTNALVQMFNRASDLSYLYTGDRAVEKEQLDLAGLVRDTVHLFTHDIDAEALQLDFHSNLPAPAEGGEAVFHMETDRELLCNALNEVLDNAFTYAEKPTKITVTMEIEGRFMAIHIRDNGIGLENEGGAALLRPFNRGDRSDDFQPFGFGFGLAYARAFLEAQGGELKYSQQPGGTDVVLTLPLPDFGEGGLFAGEESGRKIALYQENEEELRQLQEVLESDGHQVIKFSTPAEMLDSLPESRPDLVLMDGAWQGETTEPAIRKILELSLGAPLPVVVLAEAEENDQGQLYLNSGAHSYVRKPINHTHLTVLLRQLL